MAIIVTIHSVGAPHSLPTATSTTLIATTVTFAILVTIGGQLMDFVKLVPLSIVGTATTPISAQYATKGTLWIAVELVKYAQVQMWPLAILIIIQRHVWMATS